VYFAPPWASAWGEDEFGLWAEFEFEGVVQTMRWIAPGRFWMGSPENEPERSSDEVLHEVELSEGYWLADTACTQELWMAVMGENPSIGEERNPYFIPYVWKTLRRLGVPPQDLEDLVHDLFVVVHRHLGDYDPTRPVRPWLFGIAVRIVADFRRSARNVREVAARETIPPSEPMAKNGDRLGAVAAYFQQFEKEQDERRQAQNLKAAQRRKERAQTLPNRTSLLGTKADIST